MAILSCCFSHSSRPEKSHKTAHSTAVFYDAGVTVIAPENGVVSILHHAGHLAVHPRRVRSIVLSFRGRIAVESHLNQISRAMTGLPAANRIHPFGEPSWN
jgi:hypothetical protein